MAGPERPEHPLPEPITMNSKSLLAAVALAITPVAVSAAPIAVDNFGFEDPYLGSNLPAIPRPGKLPTHR